MGIFDLFWRRKTTGSPALRQSVRQYHNTPTHAALRMLCRQLRDSTLVIMLNQQASGIKYGTLVTPETGVRLEFATTIHSESNARVVPVFTDIDSFMACFSKKSGAQRESSIPHVRMRAGDLLPILAASEMGIELHSDGATVYIGGETVKKLASNARL